MILTVLDYLEDSAKEVKRKIAFTDDRMEISYGKLVVLAKRIATTICAELHTQRRKPIVVFVDRNIESLIGFLGILYSGNFYVPIDSNMPQYRIQLILDTLKPVAILSLDGQDELMMKIDSEIRIINYQTSIDSEVQEAVLNKIRRNIIDTDPMYATFTSGSTGTPKGVVTCHRSVIDMTEALVGTFSFTRESVFGNQNPFYFDASIKDIYCTLKCGASMHIIPKKCFVIPDLLVKFLNDHKIESILWSAAAIALVSNTKVFDVVKPLYLSKVMFSGEVMHNKTLNYWRRHLPDVQFVNLYGPTEITSVCTYYEIQRSFDDDEVLPIGIPFENTEVLILDADNKPVGFDEVGELCVRGCCLALGYYNDSVKTAEVFCQNPLNTSFPEKIYRTGDLAKYNEAGEIMFVSRKDNQVKHMGQRIELGEIEIVINSLELIDASICFYDHNKGKIVLYYEGINADNKYIIGAIKTILPKYMYPNILIKVGSMPYNLNGKIDRSLLKNIYLKDSSLS